MRPAVRQRVIWGLAGVVWVIAVAAGLRALMVYDNSAGPAAAAPLEWPAESRIARDANGPTLVMLAHPRCDCTSASLTELEELLARTSVHPRTYIVFIRPGRVPGGWERTALWQRATSLAGVTVVRDDEGIEARRFGVKTSGQVLLYDASGRLTYAGGTTGSRGKTGNNAGRAAILAALAGDSAPTVASVFGCALFGPGDEGVETEEEHASHAR
jgi:hypothetical protein